MAQSFVYACRVELVALGVCNFERHAVVAMAAICARLLRGIVDSTINLDTTDLNTAGLDRIAPVRWLHCRYEAV